MEGTAGGRAEASNTRTEPTEANAQIIEGELHECCSGMLALCFVLARAVIARSNVDVHLRKLQSRCTVMHSLI